MKNLSNQKLQLKQLVTGENGIVAAIESLKLLLPTESSKYNGLLQLEADFNQLKLNDVKGIVSEEQFRLAMNQIRERLLQLIDLLNPQDFNVNVTPLVSPVPSKRNYVWYGMVGLMALGVVAILIWQPWQTSNNSSDNKITDTKDLSIAPEMVLVAGTDSTNGDFYIGKYEVTVKEFKAFVQATNYQTDADASGLAVLWKNDAPDYRNNQGINWQSDVTGTKRLDAEYDNYPVVFISRDDAVAYADWLSTQTREKYRLPSKAEWRHAAKGGKQSKNHTYYGSDDLNAIAWYNENANGTTHPVGNKRPNELGLYDINGNVWEWCDALNPVENKYVALGGGWTGSGDWCLPESEAYGIEKSTCFIGFRLVRE